MATTPLPPLNTGSSSTLSIALTSTEVFKPQFAHPHVADVIRRFNHRPVAGILLDPATEWLLGVGRLGDVDLLLIRPFDAVIIFHNLAIFGGTRMGVAAVRAAHLDLDVQAHVQLHPEVTLAVVAVEFLPDFSHFTLPHGPPTGDGAEAQSNAAPSGASFGRCT